MLRARQRLASGGDLMWFRHLGREDGTFRWDGPKKVVPGWSAFTQAFSGGDRIIYGITAVVEARVHIADPTTPASGGDLSGSDTSAARTAPSDGMVRKKLYGLGSPSARVFRRGRVHLCNYTARRSKCPYYWADNARHPAVTWCGVIMSGGRTAPSDGRAR